MDLNFYIEEIEENKIYNINSNLVKVLSQYLAGDSKTIFIVNISPEASDLNATLNSLMFGQDIQKVKLKK